MVLLAGHIAWFRDDDDGIRNDRRDRCAGVRSAPGIDDNVVVTPGGIAP